MNSGKLTIESASNWFEKIWPFNLPTIELKKIDTEADYDKVKFNKILKLSTVRYYWNII